MSRRTLIKPQDHFYGLRYACNMYSVPTQGWNASRSTEAAFQRNLIFIIYLSSYPSTFSKNRQHVPHTKAYIKFSYIQNLHKLARTLPFRLVRSIRLNWDSILSHIPQVASSPADSRNFWRLTSFYIVSLSGNSGCYFKYLPQILYRQDPRGFPASPQSQLYFCSPSGILDGR